MKRLFGILGLALIIIAGGWIHDQAQGSGMGGTPFNPILGNVSASNVTITSVNAPQIKVTSGGSHSAWLAENTAGTQVSLLASSVGNENLALLAANNGCSIIGNGGGTSSIVLPCTTASGAGNYLFSAKAAQTMLSGQMYAFNITNNGTTCAAAAGSPGFPAGWSVARTGTGTCTFTFPTVTAANSMIAIPTSVGGFYCEVSAGSTTTKAITCVSNAGGAQDQNLMVIFQDWN